MRFSLIGALVILIVVASAIDVKTKGSRRIIRGTRRQRSAAELKEYHQRKRAEAIKMHKNYEITFPTDPVITGVFIGKPEQAFLVAMETGSDNFWVLDVTYPYPGKDATVYDPANFTSVEVGSFEAESDNYKLEGKKYVDNVEFFNGVNQTFGSVTDIYGEWYDPQFFDSISGSFGLAWNPALKDEPLSADSAPVLNAFDPNEPRIFSLTTAQDPENGTLTFALTEFGVNLDGVCDPNPVAVAPLSYDMVTRQMYFMLDSFAFGDKKIDGDTAKVDTGSSAIYLPWEAFEIVYASIIPSFDYEVGVYTTSCDNRGILDDFVFTLAGAELRVPSFCYIFDLGLGNNQCVLAIYYSSTTSTGYTLGVPFLYGYGIEWSIDDSTITFKNYLPAPTTAAPEINVGI